MTARTRTMAIVTATIVAVFVVLLVAGVIVRARAARELQAAADHSRHAIPHVTVIRAERVKETDLTLDATTQGIQDTVVYARTSGYLRTRHVDIGDRVTAGQLLAEIESPELDQQLRQAHADLNQAEKALELQKATLDLATATMNRYVAADAENAVAKEAVDQSISTARTAKASVAAAEATVASNAANVHRLEELTSFERVVAPFAGIVTQRNVDVGALITAGSPTNNTATSPIGSNGGANGLFQVSRIDTLRVFVAVPQAYAANLSNGLPVRVRVRGRDHPLTGTVARTSRALDPVTRTLLTEVDVPNQSHELLPGMFVYVDVSLAPQGVRWRVPATAVLMDAQGTRVVSVTANGTLRMRPVTLGRDFGSTIDIQAGLNGSETLVKQAGVSLQDGQRVQAIGEGQP
jgi:RND family efflux transporter MFP subunit